MLRAILNKFWRQQLTKQQLYGHLSLITKTIQVKQTGHGGYSWRSKDKLIRDIVLWTPSHGRAKVGRLARTYLQQLCTDTGCTWKISRERWTIEMGGKRRPGRSVLAARHDDDDDDMYGKDLALNNPQWLIYHKTTTKPNYICLIYMYKEDLALNNLQWLICHKTKPNQNQIIYI